MSSFWCEINVDKINKNMERIKETTNKKIIGVIKANAYGLGIEKMANLLDPYVDYFAVATLEEAKRVESDKEILVLTPLMEKDCVDEILDQYIFTIDNEKILDKIGKDKPCKVQIYVDTGLNRFGIKPQNLDELIQKIQSEYENIIIDGIYTHFSNPKDEKYTLEKIRVFKDATDAYKDGVSNIHCLASSSFLNAQLREAASFTTAIRVGNIIYGYEGQAKGYEKVFQYRARIIREYEVSKGEFIGYSNSFKTKRTTRVGVLEIGHIDHLGYSKDVKHSIFYDILKVIYHHIKPQSNLSCNGKPVKIIGKVYMNNVLIDMQNVESESIIDVGISAILADSSIHKKYIE